MCMFLFHVCLIFPFFLHVRVYLEEYTIRNITTMGVPATSETYSLTCTIEGVSGSPTIQWFGPGGSEISAGVSTPAPLTSTLTFTDLSLSDAGEYTCRSTLAGVVREALEVVLVQSESYTTVS